MNYIITPFKWILSVAAEILLVYAVWFAIVIAGRTIIGWIIG